MPARRLGLDLGTNSIGWCLLDLDSHGDPVSIFRTGVRIFSDGRDPKSLGSLKATRREARSARRRRDRFIQRQKFLINELVRLGLMPEDEDQRQALAFKDPYPIRKKALDEKVHPHEMGRAIFHINQRRGFKSNRKSGDNEAGVVKQSVAALEVKLMEQKARTIGEFLADRHETKDTVRARRLGSKTADLYEFYPDRAMLEQEFDKLWQAQAAFDANLYNEEAKERIKGVVFFQRKLKPQEVGRCTFLPEEKRISKALPSFQRFRIYQELSNLAWIDRDGAAHSITASLSLRDRLFGELETKKKLSFKSMRAILRKEGAVDYPVQFNLESDLRDHLIGNMTSCIMRGPKNGMMGEAWDKLNEEEQDQFILMLQDDAMGDDEVMSLLRTKYGLNESVAEVCLDVRLPDGHGALSKKAIDLILPIIRDQGLSYKEAVLEVGFQDPHGGDGNAKCLEYYGKALSGHVMGASGKPEDSDEARYGAISNPTVHIALNQVRAVINELVRLHGKPHEIILEVARDLPMGADGKRELQKFQKEGLEKNQRARDELTRLGHIDSRESRQKFQLWEQLSSDPTDRRCPFTGKMIAIADLFSDKVEIEHLLPFSQTLDDSMANKTVCYREANREKGNRSPFDAFGSSPDGYNWQEILERSNSLPYSKRWRFLPDAMKRFDADGGFLERQLNDTRYISRYTSEYLSTIVPKNKIWVATGRLTSLLRGFWGLNSVLRGHNSDDDQPIKKSRDDHRHHTVDAIVIAMTSRGLLQRVSKAARRSEDLDLVHLFEDRIDPWDGFRDEVKKHVDEIIVSHRPRKKSQGPLHNDTAYGIVEHNENGASTVVRRVPITSITKESDIEKVRDPIIRSSLLNETAGKTGKPFEEAAQNWCGSQGIKSLRILETVSIIPVTDQSGKAYKGYKGDGNAYMEIYEESGSGKWKSEIVSRFDANQKSFVPSWRKENPTAKLVMRLRINDLVFLKDEGSIYRVQKLSGGEINMARPSEANVDARSRDKSDPFKYFTTSASSLQKRFAVKLNVSPTGLTMED
ncbi:type II CRISPR RNA-guided endonuclease Cas9 [Alphaproteobacteria bacterium]|nr:type II CRISPR RNA-guided endonuclease Cas9 [Alphaproteobacteria bacterium]